MPNCSFYDNEKIVTIVKNPDEKPTRIVWDNCISPERGGKGNPFRKGFPFSRIPIHFKDIKIIINWFAINYDLEGFWKKKESRREEKKLSGYTISKTGGIILYSVWTAGSCLLPDRLRLYNIISLITCNCMLCYEKGRERTMTCDEVKQHILKRI